MFGFNARHVNGAFFGLARAAYKNRHRITDTAILNYTMPRCSETDQLEIGILNENGFSVVGIVAIRTSQARKEDARFCRNQRIAYYNDKVRQSELSIDGQATIGCCLRTYTLVSIHGGDGEGSSSMSKWSDTRELDCWEPDGPGQRMREISDAGWAMAANRATPIPSQWKPLHHPTPRPSSCPSMSTGSRQPDLAFSAHLCRAVPFLRTEYLTQYLAECLFFAFILNLASDSGLRTLPDPTPASSVKGLLSVYGLLQVVT
ncbi:hypothetical protein CCUS01_16406 [Colletotrichum cuscutae]|uniref:Uncharacterized protein n=1 Tax=Colletotrichum cuscutae TaxID=1209917 RepID=A0AAI9Y2K8_9PEZI|nr:hypothetical protein CCUS01_16406 [Colletotrichum cuscutae]